MAGVICVADGRDGAGGAGRRDRSGRRQCGVFLDVEGPLPLNFDRIVGEGPSNDAGGAPVLMVGTDPEVVESDLVGGLLACPSCQGVLGRGPWPVAGPAAPGRQGGQRAPAPVDLPWLPEDPCAAGQRRPGQAP